MSPVSREVLDVGPDRPVRPRPAAWRRPAVLVAAVVALVAAGAWYADDRRRAAETGELLACVRAADEASVPARARVSAMADYVRPAFREGTPPETVTGLHRLVAGAAAEAVAEIRPARDRCAAVAPRAWHEGQRQVHAAALAYLDLELALYRASAADGAVFFASDPDLVGARERVGAALAAIGEAPAATP
jgi:hypothetical protein